MPAVVLNQTFEAGATFNEVYQFVLPNGDPYDLSAYDPVTTVGAGGGRMRLRRSVDEAGLSLANLRDSHHATPTTDGYVEILQPPTTGQVRVFLYATALAALSWDFTGDAPWPTSKRAGVYDLEVEGAGATPNVLRLLKGTYTIDPEATRPQ